MHQPHPFASSSSVPTVQRIFIIEDEPMMAECLERAVRRASSSCQIQTFTDAIAAMSALAESLPDLILLDVLLDGPNGFTFLNELVSYPDTARIPVIIASSLDLSGQDLSSYGVVAFLHKDTMTPATIASAVQQALAIAGSQSATPLTPPKAAHA